jgi:hypothetical protein
MGDTPFACLLMSHSLKGHHDQWQESSWKLFKPINDSWPFIVIKVKKSNGSYSNLGYIALENGHFFLDWRHRDLLFRYHSNGTGHHFLFFVEKSDIKGQHLDTLPIWNRWNWTHFVFRIKIGHNISIIGHISDMKPMGVSQSDTDTDMKSIFFNMRSNIKSYQTSYRCFSFAVRYQRRPHQSNWKLSAPERLLGTLFAFLKVDCRLWCHWSCTCI